MPTLERRPANPAIVWPDYDADVLERSVGDAAAFLDEHVPGWYLRITRPIEMSSVHNCVLGQVFERPPRRWFRRRDQFTCGYARGLLFLVDRGYVDKPFVFSSRRASRYWDAEIKRRVKG